MAPVNVARQPNSSLGVEVHFSCLVPFSDNDDTTALPVNVIAIETGSLANPTPGGKEKLNEGMV